MKKQAQHRRRELPPPFNYLLIRALAIPAFLLAPGLAAQHIEFEVDDQEPIQGQVINISNQSEELPEGAYFVFIFQNCAFAYDSAITCQLQTQDHQWSFEGLFWNAGSFTIQLIGISQEGDTFEMQPLTEINVAPLTNIPPSDSCYDTAAFSCTYNNLVCNGSFEWLYDSISSYSLLHFAMPWQDLHADCDIFSVYHTSSYLGNMAGVPSNFHGHQYPYYGDSYMGLSGANNPGGFDFEVATAKLKKKLLKDQRYAIEYYTSKSDISPYSCNGAQVFFSKTKLVQNPYSSWDDLRNLINFNWVSDALGNTIITDTVNWVQYYDVFIPDDDDLEWIGLGQIKDPQDILTSYDPSIPNPFGGTELYYYYFDQVSVRPLPPLVSMLQDTVNQVPCDSVELTVIGQGAGSYLWSTGDTTSSIKVLVWNDSTFSVTVRDPENCYDTVLFSHVIVLDSVVYEPEIIGPKHNCYDTSFYQIAGGNDNYTYFWSIPQYLGTIVNGSQNFTQTGNQPVGIIWENLACGSPGIIEVIMVDYCGSELSYSYLSVYPCCEIQGDLSFIDDTLSNTVISQVDTIVINGTLFIDGDNPVHFDLSPGARIFMGPMADIQLIHPSSELRIDSAIVSGCECMWDGIYLNDSTEHFNSTASTYSDAVNAVVTDSGATAIIRNCEFYDNYKSIVIRHFHDFYMDKIQSPNRYWPINIEGTEFYQSAYPNATLWFPPYDTSHSHSAIEVIDCDTIVIGNPFYAVNEFHHLQQAIVAENSNVEIIHNKFHNIGFINAPYPPKGAVDIYKSGTSTLSGLQSEIGNGYVSGRNYFDTCEYAITFDGMPIEITLNEFVNCDYGVYGLNMGGRTRIFNNVFFQTSTTTLTGDCAITLANAVPSGERASDVLVDTNDIQGYWKGIWGTNVIKSGSNVVRVSGNSILFGSAGNATGIKADNCDGVLIFDNDIACSISPAANNKLSKGIFVNGTAAATVKTNNLLRLGTGIHTAGPGLLTSFICNNLDSCYYGFFFGENTSLSDQSYTVAKNNLNRWIGDYSDNNCNYWRRMMTDTGNIQNPVIDWYYTDNYSNIYRPGFELCANHPLSINLIDEIYSTRVTTICSFDSTVSDPFSITTSEKRSQLLDDFANNTISYKANEEINKDFEAAIAYYVMEENPGILNLNDSSDAKYQAYYDSLGNSSVAQIKEIFNLMDSGYFNQASLLNNTLSGADIWTENRKKVNAIYLDYWCSGKYSFQPHHYDTLIRLAYSSPYEQGDAVFTARVLLGLDPDKVPLPENTEAEETEHSERILTLYPNPTSGMVCCSGINNNSLDDQLTYQIFDIYGKLVHSGKCLQDKGEYCFALSTSLSEGIYFVRIWTKSKGSITGKLIFKH